ncbi:hypothetical protein pb186bvf_009277 [Paramecium bursaria]
MLLGVLHHLIIKITLLQQVRYKKIMKKILAFLNQISLLEKIQTPQKQKVVLIMNKKVPLFQEIKQFFFICIFKLQLIQTKPLGKQQYQDSNGIPLTSKLNAPPTNGQNYANFPAPSPFLPNNGQQSSYIQPSQIQQQQFIPQQQTQHHCPYCNTCQVCLAGTNPMGKGGPNDPNNKNGKNGKNGKGPNDIEFDICEDCSEQAPEDDDDDMEIDKLKEEAAAKMKQNRRLKQKVGDLLKELDRIKHLPEENENLKNQIGALSGQLKDAQYKNHDLIAANDVLQKNVDNLKGNLDKAVNAKGENDKLKKDLDDLLKKNKDMEPVLKENDDLKDKINKLKGDRDKMLADLNSLENLNRGLKDKLGKALKDKDDLADALGRQKKANDDLNKQIGDIVKDNDAKGQEVPKMKRQVDHLLLQIEDLKQENKDLDDHLKYLHDQLEKAYKVLEQNGLLGQLKALQPNQPNQPGQPNQNPQGGQDPSLYGQPSYPGGPQSVYNQPYGQFNGPNQPGQIGQGPNNMGPGQYGYPQSMPSIGPNMGTIPQQYPPYGQPSQGYPQSGQFGTPYQQQGQPPFSPNNMGTSTNYPGNSQMMRPSYEQLIQDNIRMKKVIDQLNDDFRKMK